MVKRNRVAGQRPSPNVKRFAANPPGGDAGIPSQPDLVLDYDGQSSDAGRELIEGDTVDDADDTGGSGSDEYDKDQRFAFPGIPRISPVDLDPLIEPKSAMDYMNRVRFEALQIKVETISKGHDQVKQKDSEASNEVSNEVPNEEESKPDEHRDKEPREHGRAIDKKWQQEFLGQFIDHKKLVEEMPLTDSSIELPLTFSKWKIFINNPNNEPTLPLLLSFDHGLLIKLLGYSRKWISGNMSKQFGRWIYALLLRIPSILDAEDICVLRDLARKCISTSQADYAPNCAPFVKYTLDTTITIVVRYYRQYDLDPYI